MQYTWHVAVPCHRYRRVEWKCDAENTRSRRAALLPATLAARSRPTTDRPLSHRVVDEKMTQCPGKPFSRELFLQRIAGV